MRETVFKEGIIIGEDNKVIDRLVTEIRAVDNAEDTAIPSEKAVRSALDLISNNSSSSDVGDVVPVRLSAHVSSFNTDVDGSPNIYINNYFGSVIRLWDSVNSVWKAMPTVDFSSSLSLLDFSSAYDCYAYINNSAVAYEFVKWTSDTVRSVEWALNEGVPCKVGDKTKRFIGSFYTDAPNGAKQSFTPSSNFDPARASLWYDGVINRTDAGTTSYSSTTAHTLYVQFDLGSSKTINRIVMYGICDLWSGAAPWNCTVTWKSSTDGVNWSTITSETVSITNSLYNDKDKTFASTTARYFRVEMVVPDNRRIYMLESEIYTASVVTVSDTLLKRHVSNYDPRNKIKKKCTTYNTLANWQNPNAGWREYNNGVSQVRGSFFLCDSQPFTADSYCTSFYTIGSSGISIVGLSIDSTNNPFYQEMKTNDILCFIKKLGVTIQAGKRYVTLSEYGATGLTVYGQYGSDLIVLT